MRISRVINIEDTSLKHTAISRALKKAGIPKTDWATNAEDGIAMIEKAIQAGEAYELLITDMNFPVNGKDEPEAGLYVIEELKNKKIDIPIVVCSSVRYRIPDILECIFYNERSGDIDGDIAKIVRDLSRK